MRPRPILLLGVLAIAGCGRQSSGPSSASTGQSAGGVPPAASSVTTRPPALGGPQAFVIIPAESIASYHAHEEFFAGALRRIGMGAGKLEAVGTTRAIEGQFELDPATPASYAGHSTFTVRLDTLTSNQPKRDAYLREIRDDGPSFDKYPEATFTATAIAGTSTPTADGRALALTLTGDLTIRKLTRHEAFAVRAQFAGDTLKGNATTHFLLSEFGIGPIDFYDTVSVADPIVVDVAFTARAQRH